MCEGCTPERSNISAIYSRVVTKVLLTQGDSYPTVRAPSGSKFRTDGKVGPRSPVRAALPSFPERTLCVQDSGVF